MGTPTVIQVINSATAATSPAINVGDPVNNAVRVNVVAGGGGGSSNVNIQEFGGTAVTIGQQLSAASMPVVIASDQSAVTVAQATAANLKAQVVGAGTAGTANANPVTVQGISGMTPVQVSQATASSLNATVVGAGSAGTANAGVLTVQGIASMTPVQVSQATASSLNAQVVGTLTHNNAAPAATNVGALVAIASSAAPTYTAGDQVLLSTDLSGNLRTSGGGGGSSSPANLQSAPQILFDTTSNRAATSQLGKLFPTSVAITTGLPTIGSGNSTTLTASSNVCGAIFSGLNTWGSVLLQVVAVGGTAGDTITLEIGRIPASGTLTEVLGSAVFTCSSLTVGATTTNILTGASGHSSVTWNLMDVVTTTSYSHVGDILTAVGGTSGIPAQLLINVSAEAYLYVLVTALTNTFTEVMCGITPTT